MVSLSRTFAPWVRGSCTFVVVAGCNALLGNEEGYLITTFDKDSGADGQPDVGADATAPSTDVSGSEAGHADGAGGVGGAGATTGTGGNGGTSGTGGAAGTGAVSGASGASGSGGRDEPDASGDMGAGGADGSLDTGPLCDSGVICDQRCTDVLSDPKHCGSCGRACATNYACVDGQCDSDVVEVAAGQGTSCAVLRCGEVWCRGLNQLGQLGDGSLAGTETCGASRCRPEAAPIVDSESTTAMSGVAHVSPAIWHACAVKTSGAAFCWGLNERGQLGHAGGDLSCMTFAGTAQLCNPKPTAVALPGGVRVAQISSGAQYTCASTTTGDVYCWGNNDMGQLGMPLATSATAIPTRVAGLARPAVQIGIAIYGNVSCALLDDATVWCWGQSALGGTGHDPAADPACGTSKCNPQPTVVADSQARPLADVVSIGVGRQVACALTRAGSVYCWGANSLGTLGNGTADGAVHAAPQIVSGLSVVTALSLGDEVILVTDSSGAVWGWGRNNVGSIGDGTLTGNGPMDGGGCTSTCKWRPTRTNVSNPQQLAIRDVTGIALTKTGSITVWGYNATGELGHTPGTAGDVACATAFCNPQPATMPFVPARPAP